MLASFGGVRAEPQVLNVVFASRQEYATYLRDISATLVSALSGAPARKQQQFWQRLEELVAPHTQPDGTLLFPSTTVCVGARCNI